MTATNVEILLGSIKAKPDSLDDVLADIFEVVLGTRECDGDEGHDPAAQYPLPTGPIPFPVSHTRRGAVADGSGK